METTRRTPGNRALRIVSFAVSASLLLAACAPSATPAPPAPPTTSAPASAPTSTPAPASAPAPTPTPASAPRPAVTPAPAQSPAEKAVYGGTLTITHVADPPSLDAQQEQSANTFLLTAPAYNNLIYYDASGEKIVPELAEQWDISRDGLTYTFKLRKGVTFHDGTPFTAEDAAFNLKRMWDPPQGVRSNVQYLMIAVDTVQAAGDDTVKVTMKYPFAPFVAGLVMDEMPMYPQKKVEALGHMKNTVLGTGPFKFKSYTPSVSLELVRNENYWDKGKPYLDAITFLIIKDRSTRLAALRTGQVKQSGKSFAALAPSEVATLKQAGAPLRFAPSASVLGPWFFMNLRNAPLKDTRVRRAISLAIDRQAAIKIIAEGEGVAGNFFPFEGWGIPRDELAKMPGYRQPKGQDIAEAKRLLAEAGYPNGFTMKILSRGNDLTRTAAIFMTDQLAQIGVTATVQVLEDALFFDSGRKAQHEAMVFTPGTVIGDPHQMSLYLAPKANLNFAGNDSDPKLIDLWDRQPRVVDATARNALIIELERYLLTEALPAVPIVWPTTFIASSNQERGFNAGKINDYTNNRYQETWLAR